MITKEELVERLLEEKHITAKEAVILLKDNVIGYPYKLSTINDYEGDKVPYHTICSCNPANGGSGVCMCVMANEMVDRAGLKTNLR